MTVNKDSFATINKKDYTWPYPKPIVSRPSQPPQKTKPNNYYVAKLVEPYCHCDAHLYDPQMGRYRMLAKKENLLYQELEELSNQMALLSGEVLNHSCDNDDVKMETIYQTDYQKRGLNLVKYRKLQADIDSPVGVPVKPESIGVGQGYRDPSTFRYHAFPRPAVDVCPDINFVKVPTLVDEWFAARTGQSEYEDTIGKTGVNIVKTRQQYANPLESVKYRKNANCT